MRKYCGTCKHENALIGDKEFEEYCVLCETVMSHWEEKDDKGTEQGHKTNAGTNSEGS